MAARVLLMYVPDEDTAWGLFQSVTPRPDWISRVLMVDPDDPNTIAEILNMFSGPRPSSEGKK